MILTVKQCTKCQVPKPLEEFYARKASSDGRKSQCKSCIKLYTKDYKKNNLELVRERNRKSCKIYRERHLDKVKEKDRRLGRKRYERNKDTIREQQKTYYEENKEKFLHYSAIRRASRRNSTPSWLDGPQKAHIKRTYKLREIVSKETGIVYHVDHIVPLQGENVCGLHVPWNLQVIPAKANLSKGNKF